jgi:hypothetical protein
MTNVVCLSELSILDFLFGFSNVYVSTTPTNVSTTPTNVSTTPTNVSRYLSKRLKLTTSVDRINCNNNTTQQEKTKMKATECDGNAFPGLW